MILGDLVSALRSYRALSYSLLLASAPSSPVKSQSNGLRMVSSSLAHATSEIYSRGFDEPGQ